MPTTADAEKQLQAFIRKFNTADQRLIRAVVGWHPAMWWLERRLALEREVACDQVAVSVTGSAKGYAACLVTLAALTTTPIRSLPVLAVVSSSDVGRRIARILAARQLASAPPWRAIAVCSSSAIAALGLAVGHIDVVVRAAAPVHSFTAVPITVASAVSPTLHPAPQAAAKVGSVAPRRFPSSERIRPANDENVPAGAASVEARAVEPEPPSAEIALPSRSLKWSIELRTSDSPRYADDKGQIPWASAADAGVAIGRSSQNAGIAAAGFFRRFGKRVAASF